MSSMTRAWPSSRSASAGAQPDGADAARRRARRCGGRSGRRGTPGRRSSRRRSWRRPGRGRRPCRRSCTRSRAGRCPRRRPPRRCCGPRSASPPDRRGGAGRRSRRRGTVLPAIASDAASAARSGSGRDRDRAARQALADVVVGLADRAGARRPGPANAPNDWPAAPRSVEPDRAVELAALEGAGQPGPERAVGGREPRGPRRVTEPWPRNAAAMPTSSGDAGRMADVAPGAGRVGAPGRRSRAHGGGADDRRELGRGAAAIGREQPPALADDLADRPRADRRQLAAEVLGDRGEVADDRRRACRRTWPGGPRAGWRCPVGQVSRWHWRAMSQPIATSAAVPNANSSAPSSAAIEQVAAGLEAAVGAQRDAVAQVVAEQDLVDLGQTELPRRADVLDRRQRRGAGPAGVTGQVDVRRRRPWRRRPRSSRRRGSATSLTPIRARRVDRPQVGDELGEVLDRVDVVVRRRADVALAGLAATERGDVGRRLAAGQLAALARLRALGDLDLELVGAGEVRRR